MSPVKAGGNAKLANLASNVASLLVYLRSGYIIFGLAAAASVFSILGHYIGAGIALKNGSRAIKYTIIAVLALLAIKIITEF